MQLKQLWINTLIMIVCWCNVSVAQTRIIKPSLGATSNKLQLNDIDFRARKQGGATITLRFSKHTMLANVRATPHALVIKFPNAKIPSRLQRHFDTKDFATPVQAISLLQQHDTAVINLSILGNYHQTSYQRGKQFIINLKPASASDSAQVSVAHPYQGKPISLDFRQVKTRTVLQVLAEFSGFNIVASDGVKGTVTIHLKKVPWDQALAVVLKVAGLGQQRVGNTILVAPIADIAKREQQALEARVKLANAVPLHAILLQVNYAHAKELAAMLKSKGVTLLSKRGTVSVDKRTNTLWVVDTAQKLAQIRVFIKKLDIPTKQVNIKARIVVVDKNFEQELGVKFGVTKGAMTGSLTGSQSIRTSGSASLGDRLNLNLPAISDGAASIGVALARLWGGATLDLELSALETEGGGKVLSSPTITASNQKEAVIEQGIEIPYEESTYSGATAVEFKKAVLSLRVTPHITPDHRVILSLKINQDTRNSKVNVKAVPAIDTQQIQTQVLANNGETIVLGGIFKQRKSKVIERVPFLGSLPMLGYLFRHSHEKDNRNELLIFITPKIVKQGMLTQR